MIPANGLEDRCGHNFLPAQCPYEKCGYREALQELAKARQLVESLANRVATQSELLTKRAMKPD